MNIIAKAFSTELEMLTFFHLKFCLKIYSLNHVFNVDSLAAADDSLHPGFYVRSLWLMSPLYCKNI